MLLSKDENAAMATSQVPVVLVSNNALLRTGLKHLLSGTCFLVTEAGSMDNLPVAPDPGPALFIIDACHCSTVTESIGRAKSQYPTAHVCVLADTFDMNYVVDFCKAGADGFCLTTAGRDVLIRSLELVLLGQSVFPSTIVRLMLDQVARCPERPLTHHASHETKTSSALAHRLSARESEILRGLMEGAPNKVIARQFGLSEATVKVHVKAILRKVGAGNRTQAAMWAAEHLPVMDGASRNA
jgi:two-component system nitrate/nitrite response regulator NarL